MYPLDILLDIMKMARSSYYYHLNTRSVLHKYDASKIQIRAIYQQHKGRYGYRRITMEMKNNGYNINHKNSFKAYGFYGT